MPKKSIKMPELLTSKASKKCRSRIQPKSLEDCSADGVIPVQCQKHRIRASIRELIRAMPRQERKKQDRLLCLRLQELFSAPFWKKRFVYKEGSVEAKTLLGYLPLADEPDLSPLWKMWLKQGGFLVMPRVSGTSLRLLEVRDLKSDVSSGAFGILEPLDHCRMVLPEEVGIVVTPGRAFSRSGARVGRGKGFYDRIAGEFQTAPLVAAAYDCQIIDKIPQQAHDLPVDWIVTPTMAWRRGSRAVCVPLKTTEVK